jgi:putative ABC transport system permease protein
VLAGLLVAIARDWLLGAWVVGGFALAFAVYGLVAWLVLGLLGHLRAVAGSGWRYGLAALRRRPVASLVQVLALGMGLTALLLLTLVRSDLSTTGAGDAGRCAEPLRHQHPARPAGTPAPLCRRRRPAPLLQPMIRGRLVR